MNEVAFVAEREPGWQRLTALCDKGESSVTALDASELEEFVQLYRKTTTDLALVRTESSNTELAAFLNGVVGRAYGILYRRPKTPFAQATKGALAEGALCVRRRVWFIVASAAVFLLGFAFAATVMDARPELRSYFVSGDMEDLFEHWKAGEFEERSFSEMVAMQGFYSSNNPRVAILSGSIAASTFGIGTLFIEWQNGAILGALSEEMADVGKLGHLLVSIAPHGATELTGGIISGAAGFCLGWALIAPGRKSRGAALREAGKDAFVLLLMSIIMMFLAAPVESFFSFNPNVPIAAKIAFAVVTFLAWILYWTGCGRKSIATTSSVKTPSVAEKSLAIENNS